MSFAQEDKKQNSKKMRNYKILTASSGCAGILSIGKNIELIRNYEDEDVTWKYTYYMASVLAMTLIKDCRYNYINCVILK